MNIEGVKLRNMVIICKKQDVFLIHYAHSDNKVQKAIFSRKVKVIYLSFIWKGFINDLSWVYMPNMHIQDIDKGAFLFYLCGLCDKSYILMPYYDLDLDLLINSRSNWEKLMMVKHSYLTQLPLWQTFPISQWYDLGIM